ncbi:MAG TPA: hypothetical protein VKA32_04390, partial [Gammaproteobacteria bacterium]|nr:hypothetical protein [Gammaproteobacteria bacterium]
MDLLTNAVESIRVGIEDWEQGTRPRLLSAFRNIYAEILLLYKEALRRLSPENSDEVLIKATMKPVRDAEKGIRLVGAGRRTANRREIRVRFESLGIQTDWDRLNSIGDIRNNIEHYYADVSHDSTRGDIASAFLIIRSFLVEELGEDPRELLGQTTWDVMLEASEVHAAERAECDRAIDAIRWESEGLEHAMTGIRCGSCGSDLLYPDGHEAAEVVLTCRSC